MLKDFNLSPKEFFTLPTASGQQLSAWMIKPLNFDETKKYPVLMFVYGGPGDQQVLNQYDAFNGMWYQSMAAQGYMIVCVDGRGTGGRGREFRKVTYQQLGKYETIDQTESAQYLASLEYVDGSRIGIWGWSYGGYMSSNCLFQSPETFKMAIAVAPVTNWRFYDNIYTERYMRTPQENADGYDQNSPINHVKGLKGKYLLIHGSADDNVHVQNTMRMVEELVQANKQFNVFIYPDKNHSIFGGNTRYHLYKMMTEFIQTNL
jgi:dipeptidyl-peptidase-4